MAYVEQHMSDALAHFLGNFEGLGPNRTASGLIQAYKDVSGLLTIGYGHLIKAGEEKLYLGGMTLQAASGLYDTDRAKFLRLTAALSMAQVYDLKRRDEASKVAEVNKRLKSWNVKVTQEQFDCLCDLAFNGGAGQLDHSIKDYLKKGEYDEAGQMLAQFVNAEVRKLKRKGPVTGLTWRRYTMVRYWFTGKLDLVQGWPEAHAVEAELKVILAKRNKKCSIPWRCNLPASQLA